MSEQNEITDEQYDALKSFQSHCRIAADHLAYSAKALEESGLNFKALIKSIYKESQEVWDRTESVDDFLD